MKQIRLLILLTISTSQLIGQTCYDGFAYFTFDNSPSNCLFTDNLSNPNNIWQIGSPNKTIFTSSYSAPKAIVTDLSNPYPINDTSIFIIKFVAEAYGFLYQHTASIEGKYYVNSDSLTDYGKIEFSPNNGTTWIDLLNDTVLLDTVNQWTWVWQNSGERPVLTGNSNGWKSFYTNIAEVGHIFNIEFGDTILYRFTFISDSVQTGKDGLMFDDLHFEDYVEEIGELQNSNLISIYPNPSSDKLVVLHKSSTADKSSIQILNCSGQVIYSDQHFTGAPVDTKLLTNGIYFLKYSDSKSFATKKFIINH